jgi:hypothetical protein
LKLAAGLTLSWLEFAKVTVDAATTLSIPGRRIVIIYIKQPTIEK